MVSVDVLGKIKIMFNNGNNTLQLLPPFSVGAFEI
jgi:hypothetical protein